MNTVSLYNSDGREFHADPNDVDELMKKKKWKKEPPKNVPKSTAPVRRRESEDGE